jgi:hypothetical protein
MRRAVTAAAALGLVGVSYSEVDQKERINIWRYLPNRALSRAFGAVSDASLPSFLRAPLYKLWTALYGCRLHEANYPLHTYNSLGEFFYRTLRKDCRLVSEEDLVCPPPLHLLTPLPPPPRSPPSMVAF